MVKTISKYKQMEKLTLGTWKLEMLARQHFWNKMKYSTKNAKNNTEIKHKAHTKPIN